MQTVYEITDFAKPRLPWPIRAANSLATPALPRLTRLDEEGLLATASRRTGLRDFGDASFREPLRVLVGALRGQAELSPLGAVMARQFLVQLLCTRLRAEEIIRRHPQILHQPVRAPIFIIGLPRTGTTHLHNLVSRHPALRSLPYWESLDPVPADAAPGTDTSTDPRRRRCEVALRLQHYVMPRFAAMHEMTAEAPHEEIQLLAIDFSTMLFETMYQASSYRDWYKSHEQTPAYRYLKRMLQILQWLRGPNRWLLKSPQHLEQLGPLLAVFPDAVIVQTHRDPLRVLASLCTMTAYGLRMQTRRIDPQATGRYWSDRLDDLLRGSVEGRARIPAGQVLDVRFDEFMSDDVAMATRVLEFASLETNREARERIEQWMDANPRGKHGAVRYRLETFGLDPQERRAALRFYQEFFAVPDE